MTDASVTDRVAGHALTENMLHLPSKRYVSAKLVVGPFRTILFWLDAQINRIK